MKIRSDFVTNSSSTSYVIHIDGLKEEYRTARAFIEDFLVLLLAYFPGYHYTPKWDKEAREWGKNLTHEEMENRAKENLAITQKMYYDMSLDEFYLLDEEKKIEFLTSVLVKEYKWPRQTRSGMKFNIRLGDGDKTVLGQMGDYMFRLSPSTWRFKITMPAQNR